MSNRFFRKHQKELLAVLGVLTMITFVFAGSLASCGDPSRGGGSEVQTTVATWKYGKITQTELSNRQQGRELLGTFVGLLAGEAKAGMKGIDSRILQFLDPRNLDIEKNTVMRMRIQKYLPNRSPAPEAVLDDMLYAKRAEEFKIVVSDTRINNHIDQMTKDITQSGPTRIGVVTFDPITKKQISELIKSLRFRNRTANSQDLFDAIRFEMMVQLGTRLSLATTSSPVEQWDAFCKIGRKVNAQVMSYPVKDYLAEVTATPTPAQLQSFFDKYKDSYPDPKIADPGFKVPDQVKLEYLTFNWEQYYETEKKKITDAEIQKYYDDNKFNYLKSNNADIGIPGEEKFEDEKPIFGPVMPKKIEEDLFQPPTIEPKSEPSADKKEPAKKTGKDSAPTPPGSPKDNAKKTAAKKTAVEKTTTSSSQGSAAGGQVDTKTDDTKKEEAAGKADAKKSKSDQTTASDTKNDDAETKKETKSADLVLEPKAPEPPEQEEDKYQWVKSPKVRNGIIENLATERTLGAIHKDAKRIYNQLGPMSTRWHRAQRSKNKVSADTPAMAKFADPKKGITINSTEIVDQEKFSEIPLLGKSNLITLGRILKESESRTIPRSLESRMFSRVEGAKYSQKVARDDEKNIYIVWATEAKKTHVPALADIREKVITAWRVIDAGAKGQSARDQAVRQAERKASAVRATGQSLKEYQKQIGAAADTVKETDAFSWMSVGKTENLQQPLQISTVEELENAGDELMEAIFSQPAGSIATGFNANKTIVYVVYIKNDSQSIEVLRKEFVNEIESGARNISRLLQTEGNEEYQDWLDQLRKEFEFEFDEEYLKQQEQENRS